VHREGKGLGAPWQVITLTSNQACLSVSPLPKFPFLSEVRARSRSPQAQERECWGRESAKQKYREDSQPLITRDSPVTPFSSES